MDDPYWPGRAPPPREAVPAPVIATPESTPTEDAPSGPMWFVPALFLAYAGTFFWASEAGAVYVAMALGMVAIPVLTLGMAGAVIVAVKLIRGAYRPRTSWFGLLLWAGVGVCFYGTVISFLVS